VKKRKLKRQTQPFIQKANLVESFSAIKGFTVEDKTPSAEKQVLKTEGALNRVRPTGEWSVGVSEEYAPIDHSHPIALLVRTHPQDPVVDELRYEGNQLYRWNGSSWVLMGGGGGGTPPTILYPRNEPTTPQTNELRFEGNRLYRWTGSSWSTVWGTPPTILNPLSSSATPQNNELRYEDDRLFVRSGNAWQRIVGTPPTVLFVRTDSTPPKTNELRFENNRLYRWNGSQWVEMGGTGGGALTVFNDSRIYTSSSLEVGYAEIAYNDLFYTTHLRYAQSYPYLMPVSHGRYIPATEWAFEPTGYETLDMIHIPYHTFGRGVGMFEDFPHVQVLQSMHEEWALSKNTRFIIPVGVFFLNKGFNFRVYCDIFYSKMFTNSTSPAILRAWILFRRLANADPNSSVPENTFVSDELPAAPTEVLYDPDNPDTPLLFVKRFAAKRWTAGFGYENFPYGYAFPEGNYYFVSILLERDRQAELQRANTGGNGGGGGTGGGGDTGGGGGGGTGTGDNDDPQIPLLLRTTTGRMPPTYGDEQNLEDPDTAGAVGIVLFYGAFVHLHFPVNRYPIIQAAHPDG